MIKSIVQWNEAWPVYSVVMLSNPVLTSEQKATLGCELFQYMDYINQLYAHKADWRYYDDAFRSFRQYNNTPFPCFDPELKDEAISRAKKKDQNKPIRNIIRTCQASFHPQSSSSIPPQQPFTGSAKSKLSRYYIPSGYCHLFLASLPCLEDTCPYQHTCPFCSAKHPVSQCYRPNYRHNGGRPFDHGSSRPQASRGRGGPNNYRNWLPHNLEVAGPAVLNVPKISELLEESAPELCHYVVHGLTKWVFFGL